jgi:hypothetical protein
LRIDWVGAWKDSRLVTSFSRARNKRTIYNKKYAWSSFKIQGLTFNRLCNSFGIRSSFGIAAKIRGSFDECRQDVGREVNSRPKIAVVYGRSSSSHPINLLSTVGYFRVLLTEVAKRFVSFGIRAIYTTGLLVSGFLFINIGAFRRHYLLQKSPVGLLSVRSDS